MPTETNVMRLSAATEPVKLSHLPTRMASKAAMKKVLSPISDRKTRAKAAKQPDLPKGELATYSCRLRVCEVWHDVDTQSGRARWMWTT